MSGVRDARNGARWSALVKVQSGGLGEVNKMRDDIWAEEKDLWWCLPACLRCDTQKPCTCTHTCSDSDLQTSTIACTHTYTMMVIFHRAAQTDADKDPRLAHTHTHTPWLSMFTGAECDTVMNVVLGLHSCTLIFKDNTWRIGAGSRTKRN